VAVLFKDRHLPERLQRTIFRFVLIALLQEPRLVGQARLFERPSDAQIAHVALSERWHPTEG
jgi:hypothetical protein